MGRGVVEVMGPARDEELVYLREDNLIYTERRGFKEPVATGFTIDTIQKFREYKTTLLT